MECYLEECKPPRGVPHVWNPDVEIVESLWRYPRQFSLSPAEEEVCGQIEELADSMLENQAAIVDRSAFGSPLGLELQTKCRLAIEVCGPDQESPLPFFDLMCHTCD